MQHLSVQIFINGEPLNPKPLSIYERLDLVISQLSDKEMLNPNLALWLSRKDYFELIAENKFNGVSSYKGIPIKRK